VPKEAAEADAEGMEHHASDATLKAFAKFLATPRPAGVD
jgi:DtxR family manganese transport transcriptional regulator